MSMSAVLLLLTILTGCARQSATDPAASPRAGCQVTGGEWPAATQSCDKR